MISAGVEQSDWVGRLFMRVTSEALRRWHLIENPRILVRGNRKFGNPKGRKWLEHSKN
jgi:hypothetical protein